MKLPLSMLRDLVTTALSAEEIGDLLTMAGFELEGLEEVEGEPVLDIKVVANRGDGLSAMGLAREILAKDPSARPTELYASASKRFPAPDEHLSISAEGWNGVEIQTDACSRYACRLFVDVQNGESPAWLQQRLIQSGMRPISLLVDLTNYVLLEQGQPLHAFDLAKLRGAKIIVRDSRPGEKLKTLNGVEHELQAGQMMICDSEGPIAAAGIMGGLDTEVAQETKTMLLESAHFEPNSVRKTRKQLGLSTEASYRFERWVDPEGVVAALNRFAQLYEACTGSHHAVEGVDDVFPLQLVRRTIRVRSERVGALLGTDVEPDSIQRYLTSLGFSVQRTGDEFDVVPPSWRPDCLREDDLIEEIGRVHGYEKIPELLPSGPTPLGGVRGLPGFKDKVREAMLRMGFDQTISHTLRDQHPLDFYPKHRVSVRNPHSPDMAFLRDSILPSLADAAQRNGARDLRLFEIGQVFVGGQVQMDESPELGILAVGRLFPMYWRDKEPSEADYFSLKGVIESLGETLSIPIQFVIPNDPDPRFHPTRQGGVMVDEAKIWVGYFGQIHPDAAEELNLPESTVLAELDLLVLASEARESVSIKPVSRNPAIQRDISFELPKSVPFKDVEESVRTACGDVLERQWLFDVYEGKGIQEGHHSLSIAMVLRKMGENLTDDEANQVRDSVVKALVPLGARLR